MSCPVTARLRRFPPPRPRRPPSRPIPLRNPVPPRHLARPALNRPLAPLFPPAGVTASAPAATGSDEGAPKKKRGVIIAVVVFIALGVFAFGLIFADEALDAQEDRQERVYGDDDDIDIDKDGVNLSSGGDSVSVGPDGISVTSGEDAITIGSDGSIRLDGELADEALTAVVNSTADDVAPYVGTALADGAKVEQAVRSLPLGRMGRCHRCDAGQRRALGRL